MYNYTTVHCTPEGCTTVHNIVYCTIHDYIIVLLCSACVLVDASGRAIALTLYNLAQTTHLSVGDIIAIPDPLFRHVLVQHDVSQYILTTVPTVMYKAW